MDTILARLMEEETPNLNRDLADGLATKHLKEVERYVDTLFRNVDRFFPEGLSYEGYETCTPFEEYRVATATRTFKSVGKRRFNLARTDTYMVKYKFRYKGEEFIRYLSLPFLNNQGNIHINGVRFIISPVLCDKVISVGQKDIFVKLNMAKVTFEATPQYYRANDVREQVQLIHADVYNRTKRNKKLDRSVKAQTCMTHYLFCRYGFSGTFKDFVGTVPLIGTAETINSKTHPPSEWVICESQGVKPKSLRLGPGQTYVPSTVRLAVRREDYTSKMKNHIVGFFYLLDHWPTRIRPDEVDEVRIWKQFLGELLWGTNAPLGRLESDSETHLASLDNYVDLIMTAKFKRIGMPIQNVYQLFAIIVENYNDWMVKGSKNLARLYDKELEVLYYVLSDIIKGVNSFYFKVTNLAKKKGDKLDLRDITGLLNKSLPVDIIHRLSNTSSKTGKHIEVSTINTSSDNKAFKVNAILVPQETTGGGKQNVSSNNPSMHLHTSVAEICAYSAINKRDPTGHNRINFCANVSPTGEIQRNPKFIELLDNIQPLLDRK